jgi:hypothetical protein
MVKDITAEKAAAAGKPTNVKLVPAYKRIENRASHVANRVKLELKD